MTPGAAPDPSAEALGVHEFFSFWYEWVRSPAHRRQVDEITRLPEAALRLLGQVEAYGPASVTALARTVDLDKSTVSRHLEPLRAGGLIVERPAPGRVTEVSISAEGRAVRQALADVHLAYWSDVLSHLPEPRRRVLARALAGLQRAMEAENAADEDARDAS